MTTFIEITDARTDTVTYYINNIRVDSAVYTRRRTEHSNPVAQGHIRAENVIVLYEVYNTTAEQGDTMRYTNRTLAEIRDALETARGAATLENANLFPFDKEADQKMDELRKLVKLHHETWIVGMINRALFKLEREGK